MTPELFHPRNWDHSAAATRWTGLPKHRSATTQTTLLKARPGQYRNRPPMKPGRPAPMPPVPLSMPMAALHRKTSLILVLTGSIPILEFAPSGWP